MRADGQAQFSALRSSCKPSTPARRHVAIDMLLRPWVVGLPVVVALPTCGATSFLDQLAGLWRFTEEAERPACKPLEAEAIVKVRRELILGVEHKLTAPWRSIADELSWRGAEPRPAPCRRFGKCEAPRYGRGSTARLREHYLFAGANCSTFTADGPFNRIRRCAATASRKGSRRAEPDSTHSHCRRRKRTALRQS